MAGKGKSSDPATWSSESDDPIPSSGEPLVGQAQVVDPVPAGDIDPDREYAQTINSEIGPEGEPTGEIPEGSRYHDELADTSASTHGADDSATVHEDSPQGHGWSSESLTEAGGPEDETSGEPILPEPEQQTSEGDGKAEPEPAFSKSGTRKAPRKSTSGKGR